ncbi:MAG: hypothetical protein M3Q31_16575 [Actinomycetota bacterium]|nr:hypothetical protein [Actinomycetota bacterium]
MITLVIPAVRAVSIVPSATGMIRSGPLEAVVELEALWPAFPLLAGESRISDSAFLRLLTLC